MECGSLCEIEANIELVVQLKESVKTPNTTLSNIDWNLSLMELYIAHFNTKCASFTMAS